MALTINRYLHSLQKSKAKTLNFTIIQEYTLKNGESFSLILIASDMVMTKKQVADAVRSTLAKLGV